MAAVIVYPAKCLRGRLTVPGDKSISHRYALLAAISNGRSTIERYAPGADCASTLSCLASLGVDIHKSLPSCQSSDTRVTIEGRGLRGLIPPAAPLDAGNSGTTLRLLSGILAGQPFHSEITGDSSLRRRPMKRIIDPLTQMGAKVIGHRDRPPILVQGSSLQGIDFTPPVPSAQVKSTVLRAGLQATGDTTVREQQATRDHTERAFSQFGINVKRHTDSITVQGGQHPTGSHVVVPGDVSSAAFWATAAAAIPDSDITLLDVGLNPTRVAFLNILERFGTLIETSNIAELGGEPRGQIRVRYNGTSSIEIGDTEVPSLIDELPALAALATHGGSLRVTGAGELRHKESDRITDLAAGLRALGASVEEWEDGFHVMGGHQLTGGAADATGDHRLAMAFAIAALGGKGPSEIHNAEAVDVSYPGFFETLASLRVQLDDSDAS